MSHWAFHILWGFVITVPTIFSTIWWLPFWMTLFLTLFAFVREGTQDHDKDSTRPRWQPFPWSGHKWLEVLGWPMGSLPVAVVGIWI